MNLYFEIFFNISAYTLDWMTIDPIKSLSKEENPFLANLWISNYLRHLIGVKDTSFIKSKRDISL